MRLFQPSDLTKGLSQEGSLCTDSTKPELPPIDLRRASSHLLPDPPSGGVFEDVGNSESMQCMLMMFHEVMKCVSTVHEQHVLYLTSDLTAAFRLPAEQCKKSGSLTGSFEPNTRIFPQEES